jgi:hypothetical protein
MIIGSVKDSERFFGRIDNYTKMSSEIIWEGISKCS